MVVVRALDKISKQSYPKSVFFIVGNEFCERFSYYGMRTILSLYLVDILNYTEGEATYIYHIFIMVCYFFPFVGAIIADSYLGKFRTIFYLSIVHAVGNIVIAIASSPFFGYGQRLLSLLGMLFIAIGTGGIKPCISSFGGDQFILPQQAKQLAKFFSLFYFSINAGSLLSTYITPIIRHDMQCFGGETCFPLAFGVPAALMVGSLIIFMLGKKRYICKEPQGNIILDVSKCILHAVVKRLESRERKKHWLDHAADKYDPTLISNVKEVLQVLFLFVPLPMFWALAEQQWLCLKGSRWTFQATRMDGSLGTNTLKPDQMQVLHPLLILAFIPLFDYIIYPALAKFRLLVRPLHRLSVGGLLAALSFSVSALVEINLEATYAVLPQTGQAQLRLFNGLPCAVDVVSPLPTVSGRIPPLSSLQFTEIPLTGSAGYTLTFTVDSTCLQFPNSQVFSGKVQLQEIQGVSMFLSSSTGDLTATQITGFDKTEKPNDGKPKLRVLYNLDPFIGELKLVQDDFYYQTILLDPGSYSSVLESVKKTGKFQVILGNTSISTIELGPAGIYTLILQNTANSTSGKLVTISPPNSVHMLWLLPQYIIITAAEVMFAITGLDFSYTQAPASMKSLITALWLLTISFGSLIVVIISKAKFFKSQVWEFLLFAGLMVIDMIIYIVIASRYKYQTPEDPDVKEVSSKECA